MASPDTVTTYYFYSDYNQSGSEVATPCKAAAPMADIKGIFSSISEDFLTVRLIPNGTT